MEKEVVKVVKIVKTCGACPAQWSGITDDNRRLYVRYRWGCLSISLGEVDDMSKFADVSGKEILFIDRHDPFHGYLDYDELKELADGVVDFPEMESEDDLLYIAEFNKE